MELLRLDYPFSIDNHQPCAMCFGYFDGIHQGHMGLVKKTQEVARENNLKASLFTFEPNPNFVLGKINKNEMLSSIEDRYSILERAGHDEMIVAHFDRNVASLSPVEFIENYIIKLNVKFVIVGFDYRFGYKGQGTPALLKELANNRYDVIVIDEISDHNVKIASSWIVSLLKDGQIEKANQLLGYKYQIQGEIVKGFGRGREFNFPTINISQDITYVMPKRGVYVVLVDVKGITYKGMASVGVHPTVGSLEDDLIEVNLFDFNEDVYGERVKVRFLSFIREEVKFDNVQDLINQMIDDKEKVETYFLKNL